uniref:hypothetical protein n=1 Tax=Bacteroidota TaxID=976 RepID=UPI004047B19C
MMKAVSLKQCETKITSQKADGVDLYHNLTHYVENLLACTQGTTANPGTTVQSNRIGNEVVARGLKIKFQVISDPLRPNMNFRYFVFRYEANEAPVDANFWVGPSGAGALQNRMIDYADTRNVTILKSGMVQNRNKLSIDETHSPVNNVYRDIWIPLKNKKIRYDSNNSRMPKYTTIGMAIVAYDANNTLTTDILQYLSYTTRFYFKDP